jgi:hypothetical protein
VATECRIYLSKHGIDLTAEQQPKTNKALKYFSSLLEKSMDDDAASSSDGNSPSAQG